jgi:iron complex transport system ATP-binding protein
VISFQHVYFKRNERMILTDVNFEMRKGEHWVILGRNGSGKTTILEMMNGYLFPTSGRIEVLGNVYGACDVREVRKAIGYSSQSLIEKLALRDPVWEVVATGAYGFLRFYQEIPDDVQARARDILEKIKLGRTADLPLGALSQGERKKVMLARSMMMNPRLLIMDEPCSGLDLYERERLLEDLHVFGEAVDCLVYVTHHIEEIMPLFTHVLLLDDGKVLAAGEKSRVLTAERIRDAYQVPVELDWHLDRPWIKVVR